MPILDLQPYSVESVLVESSSDSSEWIWNGFLKPGDITLLTSRWKTGKTTLLAGLLGNLGTGAPFLDRAVRPARAWIVSEESRSQWAERIRLMPLGPNVCLLPRPFLGRPTIDEWNLLLDRAVEARRTVGLDLFVVDPLASFLPGRCESDAATLLEALEPLRRLTNEGMAVLLLHHPRKKKAEVGSSARGSGALLGFVETSLELAGQGGNRRLIRAQSRRAGVPPRLAYEWDPATGAFAVTADPRLREMEENLRTIVDILKGRAGGITHKEIAEYWPEEEKPSKSLLYTWLNLAFDRKLVRREGSGTKIDPWRYRLENEDDEYRDRGELPPLKPLRW
jgi:hypothetical protein